MRIRIGIAFVVAALAASPAAAEPYRIAYEGNDFPEDEGWHRVTTGGGAERTLEDGVLTLDGLASIETNDVYSMSHLVDPGPGEHFIAEWRLSVEEVSRGYDPGVTIFSDDAKVVSIRYGESEIVSTFEGVSIPFTFTGFHSFAVISDDMLSYEFYIDGALAHSGAFTDVVSSSSFGWGDAVAGRSSLSHWDYVRFSVIPEPETAFQFFVCLALTTTRRR